MFIVKKVRRALHKDSDKPFQSNSFGNTVPDLTSQKKPSINVTTTTFKPESKSTKLKSTSHRSSDCDSALYFGGSNYIGHHDSHCDTGYSHSHCDGGHDNSSHCGGWD